MESVGGEITTIRNIFVKAYKPIQLDIARDMLDKKLAFPPNITHINTIIFPSLTHTTLSYKGWVKCKKCQWSTFSEKALFFEHKCPICGTISPYIQLERTLSSNQSVQRYGCLIEDNGYIEGYTAKGNPYLKIILYRYGLNKGRVVLQRSTKLHLLDYKKATFRTYTQEPREPMKRLRYSKEPDRHILNKQGNRSLENPEIILSRLAILKRNREGYDKLMHTPHISQLSQIQALLKEPKLCLVSWHPLLIKNVLDEYIMKEMPSLSSCENYQDICKALSIPHIPKSLISDDTLLSQSDPNEMIMLWKLLFIYDINEIISCKTQLQKTILKEASISFAGYYTKYEEAYTIADGALSRKPLLRILNNLQDYQSELQKRNISQSLASYIGDTYQMLKSYYQAKHFANVDFFAVCNNGRSLVQLHDVLSSMNKGESRLSSNYSETAFMQICQQYQIFEGVVPNTDYIFRCPSDSIDLAFYGNALSNCVATYADKIYENRSIILFLYKNTKPYICIELSRDYRITQALRACNCSINETERQLIERWIQQNRHHKDNANKEHLQSRHDAIMAHLGINAFGLSTANAIEKIIDANGDETLLPDTKPVDKFDWLNWQIGDKVKIVKHKSPQHKDSKDTISIEELDLLSIPIPTANRQPPTQDGYSPVVVHHLPDSQ